MNEMYENNRNIFRLFIVLDMKEGCTSIKKGCMYMYQMGVYVYLFPIYIVEDEISICTSPLYIDHIIFKYHCIISSVLITET